MRLRGLLVAGVVLAALAAGLYFSNKQKTAEAAKPPSDASPKILALSESEINKVVLKKKAPRRQRSSEITRANGNSQRPSHSWPTRIPRANW